MKKYSVGIIGATGMVGQRFVSLLAEHPWFEIKVLAASKRSAGKAYGELLEKRWAMATPMPESVKNTVVMDADADAAVIAGSVDFVFCAVEMDKAAVKALEEKYAKLECPVVSNNSAQRPVPDVPMVIPEVNPEHCGVIEVQRRRLGTKRGFTAVKSNCSIQSYVPALTPLLGFGLKRVLACTYQAISGAGKTFETWPEMVDNVIPYIGGEEEKSEKEPLKVWGRVGADGIENAAYPITVQCVRVPVSDGHLAAVFADLEKCPPVDEIIRIWSEFKGRPQELGLPTAPKQFIHYFREENMPQTKLHRDLEGGMAVSVGRLRPDSQYSIKFISLSHNTLRGAAGGAVLLAELLCKEGYIEKR